MNSNIKAGLASLLTAGALLTVFACNSSANETPTPTITRGTRTLQPTPTVITPTPTGIVTAHPRPVQTPPNVLTPTSSYPTVTRGTRPVQSPPVVNVPTITQGPAPITNTPTNGCN